MKTAEVAIIGGGPAGLSAAIAAANAGRQTVLFDEQPALGGQLRYRVAELDAGPEHGRLRPRALLAELLEEARASGAELHPGAIVWGLFADRELTVTESDATYALRAEQIILATGSTDLPLPVPGATLPGVFTARALQLLLNLYRVLPGHRFAVLGGGAEAAELAEDIRLAGGTVVVSFDPAGQLGTVTISGTEGVERITCDDQETTVDIVAIAVGRQPDTQLARMAECAVAFDAARGGFVPLYDANRRTSDPGILVAGDAAAVGDVANALKQGQRAGEATALTPPLRSDPFPILGEGTKKPPLSQLWERGGWGGEGGEGSTQICRCEQITAAEVRQAIAAGARSINDVKRRTRAGMGICQGIFCDCAVAAMIAAETGQPPAELAPMTARPPARLIPIGALAALDE